MADRELRESPLTTAARGAYRSVRGGYRYLRALRNRACNLLDGPVIILVYHRVTELPADPEMLAVSPENFRRQMEYLKGAFPILRFEEDWTGQRERAVVVTFDDGYADNFLEALPILEQVGVPATFFVSTGRIGTDRDFWWHRLEELLLRDGEFPARFTLQDPRFGNSWESATSRQRQQLYAALHLRLLRVGPERQQAWLEQIEAWAGGGAARTNAHRSMTEEEVRRLSASPWATVGAHTVTHAALAALSEDRQRQEIFTSKQELERITGRGITTFSYPFGRKVDYNRASVRLCREAGFIKAAANFPGQAHRWTDPFQLPRHLVRNWNLENFVAELKSFWTR